MMRTCKAAAIFLLALTLTSCLHCAPPKGSYLGDAASFESFVNKHKKDWSSPIKIAYFGPDGKENLRYAHWAAKGTPRGIVVHFNGRTEFIERNIYTYQDLTENGYDVWTMDWRGQGLSARHDADKTPFQKHDIDSYDTYLADAIYFLDHVVRLDTAKGKKVLLAHSMGGQIALRYLLDPRGQQKFDYAVLASPLLRIPLDNAPFRAGNTMKRYMLGEDSCVLFSGGDTWKSVFANEPNNNKQPACAQIKLPAITSKSGRADAHKYSHDLQKLADTDCLIESSIGAKHDSESASKGLDLRLACPTSRWLNATFRSTDQVMKSARLLKTPTIILRAGNDEIVSTEGQDDFCEKAGIYCVSIRACDEPSPGHELLIEKESVRQAFMREFYHFIGDVGHDTGGACSGWPKREFAIRWHVDEGGPKTIDDVMLALTGTKTPSKLEWSN